jgi:dienelactone hydrolase
VAGRSWRRWALLGAAALAGLWIAVAAGNTLGRYFGWTVPEREPGALAESLRPFYRVTRPPGDGPFPTALLYSGCDGPHDNLERWSAMLTERGWASIVVDSHGPRDYLDLEVWRLICAGQLFMGSERAGDVLVSIDAARRMPFVDPERLVLIGSSHGGWAVMELLALDMAAELPFNLAALPEGAAERPLAGVAGSILVYPYCGPANRARRAGWSLPAPVLFLLSGDDVIAPAEDCLKLAEMLAEAGVPVETVVLEGVTHGFDQAERAALSTLVFDPGATAEALEMAGAFLDRLAGEPPGR